ncbi:hypothetical protein B0H14DRAFT_2588530 [Mycena olivaceomarginata]|nr:hypothetical protein B0H14DRAFT_2588530 [Mycena olivaceomarginata]
MHASAALSTSLLALVPPHLHASDDHFHPDFPDSPVRARASIPVDPAQGRDRGELLGLLLPPSRSSVSSRRRRTTPSPRPAWAFSSPSALPSRWPLPPSGISSTSTRYGDEISVLLPAPPAPLRPVLTTPPTSHPSPSPTPPALLLSSLPSPAPSKNEKKKKTHRRRTTHQSPAGKIRTVSILLARGALLCDGVGADDLKYGGKGEILRGHRQTRPVRGRGQTKAGQGGGEEWRTQGKGRKGTRVRVEGKEGVFKVEAGSKDSR